MFEEYGNRYLRPRQHDRSGELREYVARRGWQIAGEYVDNGFSGSKASRPALDQLMADATLRKFDVIVVWKLDRFGRSVLNLSQHLATLTGYGTRFIAVTQGLDTDQSNSTSRLMLHILASVADNAEHAIMRSHPSQRAEWLAWQPRDAWH
jgi:DNA invertase Pin-like site-specific DNA recombinase